MPTTTRSLQHRRASTIWGWTVIAQQPILEAFAPIRSALWRSLSLIAIGALFALALAWWLARLMAGPIQQLEDGVQRIGAGQFDHRITISSGDEMEQLANRFNEMAGELKASKDKTERIGRLKRFLAPQVAELSRIHPSGIAQRATAPSGGGVLGELAGFTAFSSHAEPDIIMGLLDEYYAALGAVITKYQATLTGFVVRPRRWSTRLLNATSQRCAASASPSTCRLWCRC